MAYQFPSDEWIKALRDQLNSSDSYKRSAKNWEGDFIFVVLPDDAFPSSSYLHLQLYHGSSQGAALVEEGNLPEAEYTIKASYGIWRKVIDSKLDPIQGMMTGQLKLQGNLMTVMRYPKAAQEIVSCCAEIPTIWPEGENE